MFSEPEVEYLKSQRLARIATVSSKGQPDVVPVAFEFDGKYFYVGSHSQAFFIGHSNTRMSKTGTIWSL